MSLISKIMKRFGLADVRSLCRTPRLKDVNKSEELIPDRFFAGDTFNSTPTKEEQEGLGNTSSVKKLIPYNTNVWTEDGYLKLSAFLKFLFYSFLLFILVFWIIPEAYDAIRTKPFRFEDLKTTEEVREFLEKRYIGMHINDAMHELREVGIFNIHKREASPSDYKFCGEEARLRYARNGIENLSQYMERCAGSYSAESRHNCFRPGWEPLWTIYKFSLKFDKQGKVFGVWASRQVPEVRLFV